MSASKLLALRNVRKHRGLLGAVLTLSLIAGLLINVALVMMTQHSPFLANFAAQTNAAQAVAIIPSLPASTQMEQSLRADPRVLQLEVTKGVGILGSIPFAAQTMPANFFLHDVDAPGEMNKWVVASTLSEPVDNPIWVPASFQAAGGYELGDELVLSSPLGVRKYTVKGFVEATYGGMQGMGMLWLGLPHKDFTELAAQAEQYFASSLHNTAAEQGTSIGWVPSKLVSVQAVSNLEARAAIKEAMEFAGLSEHTWEMDQNIVIQSGSLSVGIVSVTVFVYATMIAAVAVLVLTFMLRGALRDDLSVIGALRAVGFTGAQVIRPLVTPLALLAALSGALGAGASYLVFPFLSGLLRTQTGLTWHASFSPGVLAAVMTTLGTLIWLSGALCARKTAKLSAVEALRGGQQDHSFSRNLLPLGKVRGSLPALIGLKELLSAPGHALMILVITAACSLGSVYALSGTGLLADNEKSVPLITGGIMPQVVAIETPTQSLKETLQAARNLDGVQEAFFLNQARIDSASAGLFVIISDDFDKLPLNPLYEGRFPRHANEVVVGATVAKLEGLEVGSTWTLTREKNSEQYLVTGLASSALNAGNFALLTAQGYRDLVPGAKLTNIGLYTKPGVNPEAVKEAMQQVVGNKSQVVNAHRTLQVQVSSFLSMVPLLTYSLVVFAMVVVVLVVGLFTYSLVSRSLPSTGLLKALGFTSRQAASRVRWTVLPPMLVGVIGGGAVGAALIGPLLALTLSGAGIKKVMVPIPLWPSYLVTGIVLVTALAVVFAATRPISRVSARRLLID